MATRSRWLPPWAPEAAAVFALAALAAGCLEREQRIHEAPFCEFDGITVIDAEGVVEAEDPNDWCPVPDGVPLTEGLAPARPNPSSGTVEIRFAVADSVGAHVQIRLMGPACEVVRVLVNGTRAAGHHAATWDGRDDRGEPVPPGIYRCSMLVQSRFVCEGDIQIQ